MADTKTSALTAATLAALADEFMVNEAGTSKKVTLQQIADLIALGPAFVAFVPSDYTWRNQGSCTTSTSTGGTGNTRVAAPGTTTGIASLLKAIPSTPYTIEACLRPIFTASGAGQAAGILIRDSASGKLNLVAAISGGPPVGMFYPYIWYFSGDNAPVSNPGSFVVSPWAVVANLPPPNQRVWLRLADDGAVVTYSRSFDGLHYVTIATDTHASYLTADQMGVWVDCWSGSFNMDVLSFRTYASALPSNQD